MMPDREKVINELVEHIESALDVDSDYVDCVRTDLLQYTVALLKEQEAVKPTLIREGRNKYYNDYVCPRCDNEVVYEQNYCSECGVRFLWEGR